MSSSTKNKHNLSAYESWDKDELALYVMEASGLGEECQEIFVKNSVSGKTAPNLSESNLKEMGFSRVGDRHRVHQALSDLRASSRRQKRETILWEGEQFMHHSWYSACKATCCGLCPKSPQKYQLSISHLTILSSKSSHFLCFKCSCCGKTTFKDTVVTDVDEGHVNTPCIENTFCCGESFDFVTLKSADGKKTLYLTKGEGPVAAGMIRNQVEEAQLMVRG